MALRRVPVAVAGAVAAVLAGAAVVVADGAACDDPGRYVAGPAGVELVGGCLERGDLPVAPPAPSAPPSEPPADPAVPLGAPAVD